MIPRARRHQSYERDDGIRQLSNPVEEGAMSGRVENVELLKVDIALIPDAKIARVCGKPGDVPRSDNDPVTLLLVNSRQWSRNVRATFEN